MAETLEEMIAAAARRLATATEVADELRSDPRLHRLAMETVFVLEDALVMLKGAQDANESVGSSKSSSPSA